MSTVHALTRAVHHLQTKHIAKGKARRFRCGVAALSLCEFVSLNAAGRKFSGNRWTGESKIRRLVTDTHLNDQLQRLLVSEVFGDRTGYWYCSLDHSQFGPFCIAVLAISNRAGRAIPIWIQVNVSEAALMLPLLSALDELFATLSFIAPNLKLVLVMDRWFAADKLFTLLTSHQAYFIARTKSDKKVQTPWDQYWQRSPIGEISPQETAVTYRKHQLRLIRSELKPGMKDPEPWFLLTNLPEEITRRQILNRYKERFEIEEAFKDMKWLQRLEWQRIRKPTVIRSLLLFIFLGWWLLWRYGARDTLKIKIHPKKQLSWFRQTWEQLQTTMAAQLCLLT
jgi:hypothetical protein